MASFIIFSILIIIVICGIIIFIYYKNNDSMQKSMNSTQKISNNVADKNVILNSNYNKALHDFEIAKQKYEELIQNYTFDIYSIGTNEVVYNISNSFIVYIGVDDWNGYGHEGGSPYFHVLIEELTYNNLFKFNATKFGESFENSYYDIKVNRFYGLKNKYDYDKIKATKFFYIDKKLPQLNIFERAKNWEGVSCHFIIVELYDDNGSAATIKYITNENLEHEAQTLCRHIEQFRLNYDPINKINNNDILKKLFQMKENFKRDKQINKNLIWTLRGHLRYFFISEKTTDFDLQSRSAQILENYNHGLIKDIDWAEYGRFDGKWRSEFLVFEYCQKLYGVNDVLFQYSPSFLGQMSYDVFIISKNTAIEYQGKQHFVPVEFFGGEEHYNKQVERDKKKKLLSDKNGVNLVYINYNETITEELIKLRVEKLQD